MKKIIAIIAALSLAATAMAFTSCENKEEKEAEVVEENNEEENEDADAEEVEETEETDAVEETDATEAKKLVMATNAYFQPYEFYDGEEIVGIDAEIAAAICEKLGYELEINDMEFNSIITAVKEGSVDFGMAGMTVTEERLEEGNFTSSYANGVQSIIVPEGSDITSVDSLYEEGKSYKVGVQLATTGDLYSTDDFGEENVVRYSNGNEAVLGLKGGDVDCVIIDNEPAKALVAANEGLVILETSYADEDYAIFVAKENTELLDNLNVAIDELTADGTIDAIIAKYIK